jgi:hypothetical protein
MSAKHADWAVLRAAVKLDGLKDVFVTAIGTKRNRFTISVVTERQEDRIVLCTRRGPTTPRTFTNLASAIRVSRRLTSCKLVMVELAGEGKGN